MQAPHNLDTAKPATASKNLSGTNLTKHRFDRQFFRDLWMLTKPYWTQSDERLSAWAIVIALVALNLFQIYLGVRNTIWLDDFYSAMQAYDLHETYRQFGVFAVLAAGFVFASIVSNYLQMTLTIRWRRYLTNRFMVLWMARKAYYKMQVLYTGTDNPDQRIQEDCRDFPINLTDLALGVLNSVITLVSYTSMLWILTGTAHIPLGSMGRIPIPGYGVWVALLYCAIGTWLTIKIGRPIVDLDYRQQRYEADFRFSMVRLRENAENIAFFRGEPQEKRRFEYRFGLVFDNFRSLIRYRIRLGSFTLSFRQAAIMLPWFLAMPPYFAKRITVGGYQQFGLAFQRVESALAWIVETYRDIASFQAVVIRLGGFSREIHRLSNDEKTDLLTLVTAFAGSDYHVDGLSVALPNGSPLLENLALTLPSGSRTLLTGQSGIGKTTLLRSLAQIWPFAKGRVSSGFLRPLFLPQRPYLPIGTLRDVALYPHGDAKTTDAEITEALRRVGLVRVSNDLDRQENWTLRLSLGEQQRLNFARILVQHPDGIFMDEATSSLDENSEAALYALLKELPVQPTILSVGHRSSMKIFHDRVLDLRQSASGAILYAEAV